jgi:hypothetical protein
MYKNEKPAWQPRHSGLSSHDMLETFGIVTSRAARSCAATNL